MESIKRSLSDLINMPVEVRFPQGSDVLRQVKVEKTASQEKLFQMWKQIKHLDEEKEVGLGDTRVESIPEGGWELFDDYRLAEVGILAGAIDRAEIQALQTKLAFQGETLGNYYDFARFWYELGEKSPLVDRELAKITWERSVSLIKDPFYRAKETAFYLSVADPPEKRQILEELADGLRSVLPSYKRLAEIFIYPDRKAKTLYDKGQELEEVEDGKKPDAEFLGKLTWFYIYSKEQGVDFPDLDQYLIGALKKIDFGTCDGYLARYLLFYLSHTDLPLSQKREIMQKTEKEIVRLPEGLHGHDTAVSALISNYLVLGDFKKAQSLWEGMTDDTSASVVLCNLLEYGLTQGNVERVRALYLEFVDKYSEFGFRSEGHIRESWQYDWYLVACRLALSSDKKEYHLDEREVRQWIIKRSDPFHLVDLYNICRLYPEKSKKLEELTEKRLDYWIKKFNSGKLELHNACCLLEALIVRNSQN